MKFSLALVTGASSGIGAEVCRQLARKGISLLITGRDLVHLNALAEELRPLVSVNVIVADIGDDEGRQSLIEKIHEHTPDLIINNAGFGLYGLATSYETAAQKAMIDVNATAILELTLEAAKALLKAEKKGTILNVSSVSDFITMPGLAVYAATKAFVTQFSKSIDEETRKDGIRVLVSCPGVVATDFRRRASGGEIRSDPSAMTVQFAADQMWKQIVKEKKVCVFNFKTRVLSFIARYILPQALLTKILLKKLGFKRKSMPD